MKKLILCDQNNFDRESEEWNNLMYDKHPTPYSGLAGLIDIYRINQVIKYANIQKNDRVLEIGCESGMLLKSLPVASEKVGVDISSNALKDAYSSTSNDNNQLYKYIQLDAENNLPFEKGYFNVIICSEMLEHVSNPEIVIKNICSISDSYTRIVITIPLERSRVILKRILCKMGIFKYIFRGIENDQSEWHIQCFSKKMLNDITE